MTLTLEAIQTTDDDEKLLQLLSSELERVFPDTLRQDADSFLTVLSNAPRGLRAMAGIYDLDVSMALDDLAWHFGNHNDERFLDETVSSLKELEANEAADLFVAAWEIVKPYLDEIRMRDWKGAEFSGFLEKTGIQIKTDLLSERMWQISREQGKLGLMAYWIRYARKYPEKCIRPT